jgi:hypothetical protein
MEKLNGGNAFAGFRNHVSVGQVFIHTAGF